MINAKDAKFNSLLVLENKIGSEKIKKLEDSLLEATEKGEFCISLSSCGYDIEKYLKLHGYKVKSFRGKCVDVSW